MGKIKLVIIVRTDLDMGKGKIAAQVGHASVMASKNPNSQWVDKWLNEGQPKIVLKIPGPLELDEIRKDAITLNLPWCTVEDAGRTQIAPGTITCMALGPALEEHIDKLTRKLKLL
ncbi:MAG: peptidyl-tRNA hydrolase [Cenarchaeum symbiont of Oopsacas minuta]|nr:peptidyl-tRNA hydrolase [Cenarchaeum symbiont of Oopsacas minuta]